jgi:hypothetical protein
MHVYSPNATPGTTPDVLKQVIHFDGTDTVTFRQEASNATITMQTYRLDAGQTTMNLDETCGPGQLESLPYLFYATTVGSPGDEWDQIEWPSVQGSGFSVYVLYRKAH